MSEEQPRFVNLKEAEKASRDGLVEHIVFTHDEVAWRHKNGVTTESITMREHLERLLAVNHLNANECHWCIGRCRNGVTNHAKDCPYVAAKAFLERGCVP